MLDCDPAASTYGQVVGWSELPTAGNELRHRLERLLQRALPSGPWRPRPAPERRLVVPGLRSSRTYVLDTKPDPRNPQVVRPSRLTSCRQAGYSRPHTVHCGPGGIFMSNLGGATAMTARGSRC